ncbi:MAG: CbtA family protein [Marmoricola sp.]
MSARNFLIHGLIAGLFAGFAAFLVAHTVGEPPVDAAIAVEESHARADVGHHHEEDGTVVSRENQSTWGLLTGTLAIGTALGGLVALAAAGAVGRIGRLRPSQSTALVAVIGFVAVALVPFLKYPASPPAVGNPDTIGERTGLFFTFLAISLAAGIASTVLASRLLPGLGTYRTVLAALTAYLVVVVVAAELMPTVNELGSFPAQTLWTFRRASLTTLVTLWGAIGFVLVGLVGRAHQRAAVETARRELAASL